MRPGDSVARDEPCRLETDAVCVYVHSENQSYRCVQL